MFNYKTWKLYYPGVNPNIPDDPFPVPDLVVDENGNSITPDSLKKNMTIPAEAPGNDLEKVLSNMNGADPAYPVEGASGLIKQMNELAENPPSGGGDIALSFDAVTHALNMTWAEVDAANRANRSFIVEQDSDDNHTCMSIIYIRTSNSAALSPRYTVSLTACTANHELSTMVLGTDSENDYPVPLNT